MIILKEISISNFLSHERTLVSINEGDKILIDGVSGSGKSAVIDALLWALYGRARVDNRALIRRGAKEASVKVLLYDTEKELMYAVVRKTTTSGKHSVEVLSGTDMFNFKELGTGGIRDTDEYIARQILGASYQLFINSVVLPQDNTESFVTATGARRKELLLEILKTHDIDEYLEKTRSMVAERASSLATLGGSLEALVQLIGSYDEKLADLPSLLVKEGVVEDCLKKAKIDLFVAEQSAAKVTSLYNEVKEKEATLSTLREKVKDLHEIENPEAVLKECELLIEGEDAVRQDLRAAITHNNFVTSIISNKPQLRDYDSEIEAIDRRTRKLVDETLPCPSGDACPYTKLIGPELESLKKERAKKEEDLEQQRLAVKSWEAALEAAGPKVDTKELEERLAGIDRAHTTIRSVNEFIGQKEIRNKILDIEESLKSAPTKADVTKAEKDVSIVVEAASVVERELVRIRGEIAHLETLGKEIKRLQKNCDETKKKISSLEDEIKLLNELRDAFGASGITAVALDYLLPSLEEKINEILGMLSDFTVTLSTQKDGVGGKIEGLFITVKNAEGQEFDFNSYSGGERVRISVAISEALASLQHCGFRVMDETIQALDENMIESFTSVLAKIQSRYSQLLCVSHLSPVKDMFDKRLLVKKLDGISKVM